MGLTYTWELTALKKQNSENFENIVVGTTWKLTGTDEDGISGIFNGATPFTPQDLNGDGFFGARIVEEKNTAIAEEEPLIAPIKFLGEHQKKILVLVQDMDAVHLNERAFDLLTSILNACKLTIADIALINLANKNFSLHQILTQVPSDLVLVFDINPTQLKIKLPTKLYTPILLGETQLLFSNNLSQMQGIDQASKIEKTKLWTALKIIFNL